MAGKIVETLRTFSWKNGPSCLFAYAEFQGGFGRRRKGEVYVWLLEPVKERPRSGHCHHHKRASLSGPPSSALFPDHMPLTAGVLPSNAMCPGYRRPVYHFPALGCTLRRGMARRVLAAVTLVP